MLSVVIITLNEEEKIRDCLESVKWADEIIVIDSLSTDKTIEIAKEYTDKIFQRKFPGFGEQKNFAISKAAGDWILSIDADERVTPPLAEDIKNVMAESKVHGCLIPIKTYFLGRPMKHCGWWPNYKLRLFKKDSGTMSDSLVHESVTVPGQTRKLKNPLDHYSYTDIDEYMEKLERYTSLSADAMAKKGKNSSIFTALAHSFFAFFKIYILKAGFLDGKEGFILAKLSSYYNFLKHIKLYEKQNTGR